MAKIYVKAYGCSASFSDSEMISGMIANGGHTLVQNSKESDLNVIVTCSVKDATANKMIHNIKSLNSSPLIVAGCLPKAERSTVEKFSQNASLMGPNSIKNTLDIIQATLDGKKIVALSDDDDDGKIGLPKVRLNPAVGIVQIASGCMSECTFCQTKLSKGDLASYRVGDIVRQVESEIKDGCKEIWLTSTDNGCYGFDIGSDLPELVDAIATIPEDFKIRIGMMNPMYMPRIRDGLLNSFENPKVYKFLHVPVQSGSNNVLHDMKRGHTAETFKDITHKFRKKFGEFTISTDVIVGFPTETQKDFQATLSLLSETKPDVVNLSRYSARPGTVSSQEMEQLDVSLVKKRSKATFELINQIALDRNKRWIGWEGNVIFDENMSDGDGIKGRNYAYKPIFVKDTVKIGEIHTVRITDVTNHSLIGAIKS
jgi:MiaB-like tRNA modifying enzyme